MHLDCTGTKIKNELQSSDFRLRVCYHQSKQLESWVTSHSHSFRLVAWYLPASQTSVTAQLKNSPFFMLC